MYVWVIVHLCSCTLDHVVQLCFWDKSSHFGNCDTFHSEVMINK